MRLNGAALAVLGAGGPAPLKVQNLFAVNTWAGNGGAQTITNGLAMSGASDAWVKWAGGPTNTEGAEFNSTLGAGKPTIPNRSSYSGVTFDSTMLTGFSGSGFSLGSNALVNAASQFYKAWSFVEAKGFFKTITFTGGGNPKVLSYDLGAPPGLILINRLTDNQGSFTMDGVVWHRSFAAAGAYHGNFKYVINNPALPGIVFGDGSTQIQPTQTAITLAQSTEGNYPTETHIARIFAHQPGPAGIVACGSFTTDASGNAAVTDIGWRSQFVMFAAVGPGGYFAISDDASSLTYMWNVGGTGSSPLTMTSSGFTFAGGGSYASQTICYCAIRKGPL